MTLAGLSAPMRRLLLVEIHGQDWCPRSIRDAVTDYLQFTTAATKHNVAMVPILASALQRTGTRHVLDLGSGVGRSWHWLPPVLARLTSTLAGCRQA